MLGHNPALVDLVGDPQAFFQDGLGRHWPEQCQTLPHHWQQGLPGKGLIRVHVSALDDKGGLLFYLQPVVDPHGSVLDLLAHPIFVQCPDGSLLAYNRSFADFMSTSQPLLGTPCDQLFCQDWHQGLDQGRDALLAGSGLPPGRVTSPDGKLWWVQKRLLTQDGQAIALISEMWDMTRQLQMEAELSGDRGDKLTGLSSREEFLQQLEDQAHVAKRIKMKMGLMLLDLKNFQQINDDFGHQVGDALLKAVSQRVRQTLRETDVLARLEGDRFAIMAVHLNNSEAMAQVHHKLALAFEKPFELDGKPVPLGFRAGVAIYPDDAEKADTLFNNAELALHQLKKDGGEVRFYDERIDAMVRLTRELGRDLRGAAERGEFFLRFQPIVSAYGNKLLGVESLVRWQHPKHGMLVPQEFVYIAEHVGLITELGSHVLDLLNQELHRWLDYGIYNLCMTVNISPQQLRTPELFDKTRELLAELGGPDQFDMELELNEAAIHNDGQRYAQQLHDLKKLGIRLSIDEFGSINGALNNLTKLPIDTIKIDRHFIAKLGRDPDAETLVKAIIRLGKDLGIRTSAVGVEELEQLNFLRNERCDQVQGFAVSEPMSGEDFITWYHNFNLVRGGIQP
ncbi:bifunctional diguanylate cyclase/phosphodiesterase [Gallaecimonas xiamenensis]|uniref:Diguanylate cyclase/phosphodiesterase with PAS/PAC sensor(S) n=1 Tax=Gallaecimonas xiamenensis 3-C-1 TaxID=745411 RepID=K2JX46_9GAMM|nr:bifunctional diguanylate cyclase/phosphodiesterase [Gallaecimonas xiamenensis]EKE74879.1 diguanylate cyclase/phosphodiesterase with PAS/PAC sensor(s) [Gallaecimonas xiamenensis 3-C-1]